MRFFRSSLIWGQISYIHFVGALLKYNLAPRHLVECWPWPVYKAGSNASLKYFESKFKNRHIRSCYNLLEPDVIEVVYLFHCLGLCVYRHAGGAHGTLSGLMFFAELTVWNFITYSVVVLQHSTLQTTKCLWMLCCIAITFTLNKQFNPSSTI